MRCAVCGTGGLLWLVDPGLAGYGTLLFLRAQRPEPGAGVPAQPALGGVLEEEEGWGGEIQAPGLKLSRPAFTSFPLTPSPHWACSLNLEHSSVWGGGGL